MDGALLAVGRLTQALRESGDSAHFSLAQLPLAAYPPAMPRLARIVAPGVPHHVTQRGNFGQPVFETEEDRHQYLTWLAEAAHRYGMKVWAYCLMTNHIHAIAVPIHVDSLARTFNQTHMRYAQHCNRQRGRVGHLWQGRFYSCALEEPHLYAAVRYVERNPVRARLVSLAEAYPWSSAPAHVHRTPDPLLAPDCPLLATVADWAAYLATPDDASWTTTFRQATRTGRPAGSPSFVARLESLLTRILQPKARGRPRRKA
ncbi:MAG: transposase [Candidatus Methylomirabilales bacterium]